MANTGAICRSEVFGKGADDLKARFFRPGPGQPVGADRARSQSFIDGIQYNFFKTTTFYVRPVRAFG